MSGDVAKRISRRHLLGLAIAASTATGAHARDATPTPPGGVPAVIRIAVPYVPGRFDPLHHAAIIDRWLSSLTFDAPLRWDEEGRIVDGIMRTAAEPSESLVRTYRLRDDVRFPDGRPVTSTDVRYTMERARASGDRDRFGWRFTSIRSISSVDERTIRVRLNRTDVSLDATMAHPALGVVPAGADARTIRAGSGPFTPTAQQTYVKHAGYWEFGRPRLDELKLIPINDDAQRSIAIALGKVHVMPNVPLLDVPMLQGEPSVYLAGGESNRVCYLAVNHASDILREHRIRLLLSLAIDRKNLVNVAAAGQGTPTSLLFSGKAWNELGNDEQVQLKPADVRERIAEMGIPSDIRLRLLADNADATLATTAVVLQEQLANCGIALSVNLLEGDALAAAIRFGEFDLLAAYSDPWRDPHELVHPLLSSDGVHNVGGYARDEVDTLITTAVMRSDRQARRLRYGRIERWMLSDVPMIVLFRPHYFDAVSSQLAGYRTLPPVTSRGLMTVGVS